jgi:hypothetical protein
MKNTVCYVVQCSEDCGYDYRTWVSGIYLNALDAENLRKEIEVKNETVKNIPCPFKDEDLEFLSDEQKTIYHTWWNENDRANEFNGVFIT